MIVDDEAHELIYSLLMPLAGSDLASPSQRRKAEPAATAREPHDRLINLRPMSLKRISAR